MFPRSGGDGGNGGFVCPICYEPGTTSGDHRVCCLPCGHVYGMSCIKKWLESSTRCPQCKDKCTLKDIRVHYATQLCDDDEELHKAPTKEEFSTFKQDVVSRIDALERKLEAEQQANKLKWRAAEMESQANKLKRWAAELELRVDHKRRKNALKRRVYSVKERIDSLGRQVDELLELWADEGF